MTDRELMQQLLEALEKALTNTISRAYRIQEAITVLHKRLARGEQEPWEQLHPDMGNPFKREEPVVNDWAVFNTGAEVASGLSLAEALAYLTPARLERVLSASCVIDQDNAPSTPPSGTKLYTTPAPREWVGLTDEEIYDLSREKVKGQKSVNWLAYAIEKLLRSKNEQA